MNIKQQKYHELIEDYITNDLNESNAKLLLKCINTSPSACNELREQLQIASTLKTLHLNDHAFTNKILNALEQQIKLSDDEFATRILEKVSPKKQKILQLKNIKWLATAASIAIILMFFTNKNSVQESAFVKITIIEKNLLDKEAQTQKYLSVSQIINTYNNQEIIIRYLDDNSKIKLKNNTSLNLIKNGLAKHLTLNKGTIICDIAHQKENMLIKTPHGTAEVLGTKFSIKVTNSETYLNVTKNSVKLQSSDKKITKIVHANEDFKLSTKKENLPKKSYLGSGLTTTSPMGFSAKDDILLVHSFSPKKSGGLNAIRLYQDQYIAPKKAVINIYTDNGKGMPSKKRLNDFDIILNSKNLQKNSGLIVFSKPIYVAAHKKYHLVIKGIKNSGDGTISFVSLIGTSGPRSDEFSFNIYDKNNQSLNFDLTGTIKLTSVISYYYDSYVDGSMYFSLLNIDDFENAPTVSKNNNVKEVFTLHNKDKHITDLNIFIPKHIGTGNLIATLKSRNKQIGKAIGYKISNNLSSNSGNWYKFNLNYILKANKTYSFELSTQNDAQYYIYALLKNTPKEDSPYLGIFSNSYCQRFNGKSWQNWVLQNNQDLKYDLMFYFNLNK